LSQPDDLPSGLPHLGLRGVVGLRGFKLGFWFPLRAGRQPRNVSLAWAVLPGVPPILGREERNRLTEEPEHVVAFDASVDGSDARNRQGS